MFITIIRATVLYVFIVLIMRFMGKRQVGEMQPVELVITILLSEIAAVPLENNEIPLINSIFAATLLASYEIINSVISLKSNRYRTLLQGHSVIVIKEGVVDQRALRKLRISLDDLLTALRQNNVFDISQVYYAILETNGKLSVLQKKTDGSDDKYPVVVICDGEIEPQGIKDSKVSESDVKFFAEKNMRKIEDIFIMTVDESCNINIIDKE